MNSSNFIVLIAIFFSQSIFCQTDYYRNERFSLSDTLRGQLRKERTCFDIRHYNLEVKFDLERKAITGKNEISFDLIHLSDELQIDLFENMQINSIMLDGVVKPFRRIHNAIFIDIKGVQIGNGHLLKVIYQGSPKIAANPPWDGGFQWTSDDNGNPWVNVSCQGIGASLWWPNKDHPSDEPDSMSITLAVPKPLVGISNGDLISSFENEDFTIYSWEVDYPINNYNVTFSIGNYEQFSDSFRSPEKGPLKCDYYVMPYNLEKAKSHFKQVNGVLEAFEHYLGPYPFWEDGYALVEVPYLGMEHQSAIAYGNRYNRGYMGGMIPQNMNWDYIIVHETGHEYWGNAVTASDFGDLWLQESFCTYMEALYVEYHMGKKEAVRYLSTQRMHQNEFPIIGPMDVNFDRYSSSDQYFKGAWVLHTLRNAINDDELFFSILRQFYEDFKYKSARSKDFFDIVNRLTENDYDSFFQQYLYHPDIPKFEYKISPAGKNLKLQYRWVCNEEDFEMPIRVGKTGKMQVIKPSESKWKSIKLKDVREEEFKVSTDLFLIDAVRLL